jgi:hypothetical protein
MKRSEKRALLLQRRKEVGVLANELGLFVSEHPRQNTPMIKGNVFYLRPSLNGRAKAIDFLRNLKAQSLFES